MRHFVRGRLLLSLLGLAVSGVGAAASPTSQDRAKPAAVLPVPPNVKAEGLTPVPASIPEALEPYGASRRALLLGWHPTRREILISTIFGNVPQIHSVAGPGMDRRQVTFFREGLTGSGGASYEPGGTYFVYGKDTGGGAETMQLFRFDPATLQSTLLTDGKSRNGNPAWSRHSGLIAFESTRRGGHGGRDRDLYVMDPRDPASTRLVTELDGSWSAADWSADDREILVAHAPTGTETHLWRVDVKTGAKKLLTPEGEVATWRAAQYSPDGRFVYALSNRGSEAMRVWRCDVKAGTWKLMTGEDDALESFSLSPDGRTLALVYDGPTASRLEFRDAASLALRSTPKIPVGVLIGAPQWRGAEVAFTLWSFYTFGDVYSANARTGAVQRWTTSETGSFNPEQLPAPEIITWKSFDGLAISGVLYRPHARFKGPRPVIVSIHGGPAGANARERPRYQGRSNYFLNELGVAIVYPNVRGSYGFGKAFGRMDDGAKREDAVKDIGALLDWIARQPGLDKTRVMVTGISYGGFMTYAVAEAFGDRLRCALAASAISNFITYFKETDPTRPDDRRAEYGDERIPEMAAFLTRISPVTQASKLRIPLMIVHGAKDTRVPIDQAQQMAQLAGANGVPVWLTVYGDEGHVMFLGNVANNNFFFYTWIHFVQQYLLN
jgi:dipeptidyl aminopeptidase/acylaminoacyl peptidase